MKPLKTPKTTTKIKMSMPKTPATEPSTKKKSSKSKSAKAVKSASEDDAMTPKAEEKPLTAQQLKENKEKKGNTVSITFRNIVLMMLVLYYRHKLQRGFLSRDNTPRDDEMKVKQMLSPSHMIKSLICNRQCLSFSPILRAIQISKVVSSVLRKSTRFSKQ